MFSVTRYIHHHRKWIPGDENVRDVPLHNENNSRFQRHTTKYNHFDRRLAARQWVNWQIYFCAHFSYFWATPKQTEKNDEIQTFCALSKLWLNFALKDRANASLRNRLR